MPPRGLRGRDGCPYHAPPDLITAANAALALRIPLLLTGEPGCGKTDFAFAVARALDESRGIRHEQPELLECYVRSDTQARDLLYHYDSIRRFGDAQHGGPEEKKRSEGARNYIELRDLGRGLLSEALRVVLIDEIDKAPRDLPNDLLRELDQGRFEIPELPLHDGPEGSIDPDNPRSFRRQMQSPDPEMRPFVIITSNVERQLPDPFLRRCVFYDIQFPEEPQLAEILKSRFEDRGGAPPYLQQALEIFWALRQVPNLTKPPTTSELIHWVQALQSLHADQIASEQLDSLTAEHGQEKRPRDLQWDRVRWRRLPAFGCLIKLREDLERLGPAV